MELSQTRPCGAQGAKPTHDFLSLYSPAQQDPTPSIPGSYLKTHDFLQPLEQSVTKEGCKVDNIEKCFPPSMVEHMLPGGMGTYSINQISYMNQSQKVPKAEGTSVNVISGAQSSSSNNNDENSNCSSYTGSGFMVWEDSNNVRKGKTRKENIKGTPRHTARDGMMKIGIPWMASSSSSMDRPSQSFTSLASSSHRSSVPKNQYFVELVKSAMNIQQDNDEEFVIKKEPLVKVDPDQKPNSPRSKHSATEQRRRSKINDRFSMLRGIIPHGDQKRDKASFLLEVIEYIQFLQEKVHKYEDSYHGWSNEQPATIPLNNKPTNDFMDQPQHPNRQDPVEAQPRLSNSVSCNTDKLKDEVIIESGRISISTIYSQGLSSALTEALKSSGVDLSQANISVKIDLGKKSKENEIPLTDERSRVATTWEEESGEDLKRLKTSRN